MAPEPAPAGVEGAYEVEATTIPTAAEPASVPKMTPVGAEVAPEFLARAGPERTAEAEAVSMSIPETALRFPC